MPATPDSWRACRLAGAFGRVCAVYYCTFTLASVVGGAVVYDEFRTIAASQLVLFACGMLGAVCGVAVLMSGRGTPHRFAAVADGLDAAEPLPPSAPPMASGGEVSCARCATSGAPPCVPPYELAHDPPSKLAIASPRFVFLEPEQKVDALDRQSSASRLVGGVGASLLQASVDTEIATDRPKAVRTSEEANYPSSLGAANRIIQRRSLPVPMRVAPICAYQRARPLPHRARPAVGGVGSDEVPSAPSADLSTTSGGVSATGAAPLVPLGATPSPTMRVGVVAECDGGRAIPRHAPDIHSS